MLGSTSFCDVFCMKAELVESAQLGFEECRATPSKIGRDQWGVLVIFIIFLCFETLTFDDICTVYIYIYL